MSANYWTSSQYKHWTFTREQIDEHVRHNSKVVGFTEEDLKLVENHHIELIIRLGKKVEMRQRAVCTGIIFWKRFFLKHDFSQYSPRLIGTTCIYIASKAEECILSAQRLAIQERNLDNEYPYDVHEILEAEWHVLAALKGYLIVYHPHRSLATFFQDRELKFSQEAKEIAWQLVNDAYFTDLVLVFPPFWIALAAVFLTCFKLGTLDDTRIWFASAGIDLKEIWGPIEGLIEYLEQPKNDTQLGQALKMLPRFNNHRNPRELTKKSKIELD